MMINNATINKIDVHGDNNNNSIYNDNYNNDFIYSRKKLFIFLEMAKARIQIKKKIKPLKDRSS